MCGAIRYASGAETVVRKGLQCTEKACKILRKGNLRRLLKMAGPLEVLYKLTFHHDSSSK